MNSGMVASFSCQKFPNLHAKSSDTPVESRTISYTEITFSIVNRKMMHHSRRSDRLFCITSWRKWMLCCKTNVVYNDKQKNITMQLNHYYHSQVIVKLTHIAHHKKRTNIEPQNTFQILITMKLREICWFSCLLFLGGVLLFMQRWNSYLIIALRIWHFDLKKKKISTKTLNCFPNWKGKINSSLKFGISQNRNTHS